jgi:hypothetical protein
MDAEMNGGGGLLLMWTSCESIHKSAPWGPSQIAWSDLGVPFFPPLSLVSNLRLTKGFLFMTRPTTREEEERRNAGTGMDFAERQALILDSSAQTSWKCR